MRLIFDLFYNFPSEIFYKFFMSSLYNCGETCYNICVQPLIFTNLERELFV